jgi:hypothetical protein
MTEEKRQGKKWGIIKRIFLWIWRGLLTALIIGAIIFEAPWKVLAILLIFLAACTILPKPARKWFWLSVAAVVIALIIWIFLPDKDGGWRPYTFDKELAALKAKYEIPDSENAALLYNRLFESYDSDSNKPDFFNKYPGPSSISEPWLSKDHPETAEWLKSQQKTIDTLMEISRIEKCRFPITADFVNVIDAKILSKMRHLALLLVSAANNDIAEGRTDDALKKYFCIIQMAKHLYQQPDLIDSLTGSAVEALALARLKQFMIKGRPSSEQLQLITNSIKELKNDWSPDLRKWLDVEKLRLKNFLSISYETNEKGKTRLNRNPYAAMGDSMKMSLGELAKEDEQVRRNLESILHPSYFRRKRLKASTILGWFYWPATPQDAAKTIDAAYEKHYTMADPDFEWPKKPIEWHSYLPKIKFELNYRYFVKAITDTAARINYTIHEA